MEEVEVPIPEPGEVCVRTEAAGICGSDIPRIYGTGAHRMPIIPGHEFSGVVEGIGKDAHSIWLGKRVGVYPLIACGRCYSCETGHPEVCEHYGYIGSRQDGAFAEYVCVPEGNLIQLPDEVSFEQGAMLEPLAVASHAIGTGLGASAGYVHGAKMVVCGLGTIGLLVVMLLKERAFDNIYVIGNKKEQKTRVTKLGVPEENFCDSTVEDVPQWLKDHTGGVDAFFECVGKNECLSYGVETMDPFGNIILIGNPLTDMILSRDAYWRILREQITVTGSWNSTFLGGGFSEENLDDWHYVMKLLRRHRIHPEELITHRLRLDELETGLQLMQNKTKDHCKIMMIR